MKDVGMRTREYTLRIAATSGVDQVFGRLQKEQAAKESPGVASFVCSAFQPWYMNCRTLNTSPLDPPVLRTNTVTVCVG